MFNYLYQAYYSFHMDTIFTTQLVSQQALNSEEELEVAQALYETDLFLKSVEQSLSPFIEQSSLSRYRRLEPVIDDKLEKIIRVSKRLEEKSNGLFLPYDDKGFNPTSFVKGWAVEEAIKLYWTDLVNRGVLVSVILNGGGDMFAVTHEHSDFDWHIKLASADSGSKLDKTIRLRQGGIATSGKSQRGNHFWNKQANTMSQVTLIGQSLVEIDAWSTLLMTLADEEVHQFMLEQSLTGVVITKDNHMHTFEGGHRC